MNKSNEEIRKLVEVALPVYLQTAMELAQSGDIQKFRAHHLKIFSQFFPEIDIKKPTPGFRLKEDFDREERSRVFTEKIKVVIDSLFNFFLYPGKLTVADLALSIGQAADIDPERLEQMMQEIEAKEH